MAKTKEKEVLEEVKETNEEQSPWYYFYSVGCGFCKKAEPIIDELIKEGHNILKLDMAEGDNQKLNQELKKEYGTQCGTPWFINADTGKGVCGFREKDIIEKWLDGEDIPAPPRPKSPPPKIPFQDASEKEIEKWKEEYQAWVEENSHLPKHQTVEEILERPRPKSDPPKPPSPNSTDEQLDGWAKEYDKWVEENTHLPNLQPSAVIIDRYKKQRDRMNQQNNSSGITPSLEARFQRIEQKVDKLIKHLGVK